MALETRIKFDFDTPKPWAIGGGFHGRVFGYSSEGSEFTARWDLGFSPLHLTLLRNLNI